MDYEKIGRRIRQHRKENMLSQEQLAEMVGISVTHMSHIETGNTKLSLQVLVDLSQALHITVDALLYERNDTIPETERLAEVLQRCSESEIRILTDILIAAKESMDKNRS